MKTFVFILNAETQYRRNDWENDKYQSQTQRWTEYNRHNSGESVALPGMYL